MNSTSYLKASGLFSSRHKRALITDVSSAVMVLFVCLFLFVAGQAAVEEVGDFEQPGLRMEELMQEQTAEQQDCTRATQSLLLLRQ